MSCIVVRFMVTPKILQSGLLGLYAPPPFKPNPGETKGGGHTSHYLKDPHLKRQNDVIATFGPAAAAKNLCFFRYKNAEIPLINNIKVLIFRACGGPLLGLQI